LPNTDKLHDYSAAWAESMSCKKQEDCTHKLQLGVKWQSNFEVLGYACGHRDIQ